MSGARPPKLSARLEYAAYAPAKALCAALGLERATSLMAALARGIGPLALGQRARKNLRIAFPDLLAEREAEILSGMFDHLARTAIEYVFLQRLMNEPDRIEISGAEHFRAALAGGHGVVIASGHLGNWEAIRLACAQLGTPPALIYRGFNNGLINADARAMMQQLGAPVLIKGRRGTLALVRHLRGGGAAMILTDQRFRGAPELDFFGRGATTALAAAELSQNLGAPLLPVRASRIGRESRFRVTFEAPIELGEGKIEARAAMQTFNRRLEGWIRETPEQYFWLHNRWRKA